MDDAKATGILNNPARIRRRYNVALVVLFAAGICIPWISDLFSKSREMTVSKSENRVLSGRPVFNASQPDSFPAAYEKYYNDHFFCRSRLMKFNTFLTGYYLFRQSPVPDKVALGSEGWLYSTGREREVYGGVVSTSGPLLEAMVNEMRNRARWYRERGIAFFVTVVPMKSVIYPEFLPHWYLKSVKPTFTELVTARWEQDTLFHYIDLKTELISAKEAGALYYKTDNHWNGHGAWYAYRTIIARMMQRFPSISPLQRHEVRFSPDHYAAGDLARLAGLDGFYGELVFNPRVIRPRASEGTRAGYPVPKLFGYPSQYEIVMETADTSMPKIVVIRDSFFSPLTELISEHFSKSVFLFDAWHYGPNFDIIEKEKPDIVLLQIYEPHLANVLYRFRK